MNKEQPEALRLAEILQFSITKDIAAELEAAAELRRLHAENEALRAQIGQGVPVAWCLGNPMYADSSNVFLANEFTPDGEHEHEWTPLYTHPAPQQKPLTDEQITAGAKALCKRSSEICGVNADDNWNLDSEYFKDDARCVLEAAHNIGEKK